MRYKVHLDRGKPRYVFVDAPNAERARETAERGILTGYFDKGARIVSIEEAKEVKEGE